MKMQDNTFLSPLVTRQLDSIYFEMWTVPPPTINDEQVFFFKSLSHSYHAKKVI